MPAVSEKQRRFFGMQLSKMRSGQATDVKGMSEKQLSDFAAKPIQSNKVISPRLKSFKRSLKG
jgi:hypothetical protein